MTRSASPLPSQSAASLLLGQRRRRVRALQWKALQLIIDPISLLYLVAFLLLMISFARETLVSSLQLEAFLPLDPVKTVLVFVLGGVWFSIWDVFNSPRYPFTYSDFLLHFLPVDLNRHLKKVILRHQLIRLLTLALLLAVIALVQGWLLRYEVLSRSLMLMLFGAFVISDFARGLVQWYVFQQRFLVRLAVVLAVPLLSLVALVLTVLLDEKMAVWVLTSMLALTSVLALLLWVGLPRIQLDWERIITYGEHKTWNGLLVKLVTGAGNTPTTVTRPWITPKHPQPAKRLPYKIDNLLAHQWGRYLWREKRPVLVPLVFFSFVLHGQAYQSQIPYFHGIAFLTVGSLLVYILTDMFAERLQQPILRVLPWPLREMVQSYLKMVLWVLIPLLVPQMWMLSTLDMAWWEILLLVAGEILLFIAYFERTLARRAVNLTSAYHSPLGTVITWALFVLLTAAMTWQPLSAPLLGGFAYWWVSRQYD